MIFSLLACIYITGICWSWGIILFSIVKTISREEKIIEADFIITCFSGLALVSVITGFLSLFTPLGGAIVHLWLILPIIVLLVLQPKILAGLIMQVNNTFRNHHPVILISLAVCLVLSLIMGAGKIIHPDSLHYHAPCIQWIENYKVIPGLANLGYHFGLQSSWFPVSAIFSFNFTASNAISYLNIAVIVWYVIFLHQRLSEHISKLSTNQVHGLYALLWFLLFVFSFWSFTQVRSTLTSASPDFIVTIYIWLIFYLFNHYRNGIPARSYFMLILFLGAFSVTIKLSGVPAAFFTAFVYLFYAGRKFRHFAAFVLITMITVSPFITRNIITTGYPIFPSPALGLIPVDWKLPAATLHKQSAFIKAYARVGNETVAYGNKTINGMRLAEWLPIWWQNRSFSNKLIIAAMIGLLLIHMFLFRKIKWKENKQLLYSFLFLTAGIILWFKEAPDPRFGFGYIIPLEAILLQLLIERQRLWTALHRNYLLAPLFIFSIVLMAYSAYRLQYFFKVENILNPSGIPATKYETINCYGINFNKPLNEQCGSIPTPCVYLNCKDFTLRGEDISDGFKPAKQIK